MKKTLSLLLTFVMVFALLVACAPVSTPAKDPTPTKAPDSSTPTTSAPADDAEIVNGRFVKTRKITVEIYDRSNDGGSKPEDNFYTDFIKEAFL